METRTDDKLSVKTVRKACIECAGGAPKYVLWCPCDGLHSTACAYWPFRLGMKPATVRSRYGDRLITPEKMPSSDVELEKLPDGFQTASTSAIDVEGYRQDAVVVERKPTRQMTPEQREAARERMQKLHERKQAARASA